jgi:KaiC/GvpD/RAD55 family RecA-like ATPase
VLDQAILGIPELDSDLAVGLPPGWLALLIGRSGSGTHLVAKQFAHAGVGETPVLYYTTYERIPDVERAFRDFGWDPGAVKIGNLADEYYERVLSRDLEVSRIRDRGLTYSDLKDGGAGISGPRTYDLTNRLLAEFAAIDSPFRLVLDSIDFLLERMEPTAVISLARQIRHRAQTLGGQAMLVVQEGIHDRRTTGLLEDMADLVLESGAERQGGHYEHVLAVRKVRNHPERTRIVTVEVTSAGLALRDDGAERPATDEPSRKRTVN